MTHPLNPSNPPTDDSGAALSGRTGSVISDFLERRITDLQFWDWIHAEAWKIKLHDTGPEVEMLNEAQNLLIDENEGDISSDEMRRKLRELISPNTPVRQPDPTQP